MTGNELLKKLQAIPSDQRDCEVVIQGDDVGKFRETVYTSASDVQIMSINDDGREDDDEGKQCIAITL